jgi:hypothetical protein
MGEEHELRVVGMWEPRHVEPGAPWERVWIFSKAKLMKGLSSGIMSPEGRFQKVCCVKDGVSEDKNWIEGD